MHDHPNDQHARQLLLEAGVWGQGLHEEIWVFDRGFWSKDAKLWLEVQKVSWDDIILNEKFKTALRQDVTGFFASEEVYKKLSVPWKVPI